MGIDKTASRKAPALTAPASQFANWRNCVSELSAPPAPAASHHASAAPLDPLFNPRSIALVGATERSVRSEEHTSELQSLMRISYAVFCLKKKKHTNTKPQTRL